MVGFLSRHDMGICGWRVVVVRIGHWVGLKFCQINIQCSIKSEGSSDREHNLTYQSIQVSVNWVFNIKVSMTDVIDVLIVYYEGTIRVLWAGGKCGWSYRA